MLIGPCDCQDKMDLMVVRLKGTTIYGCHGKRNFVAFMVKRTMCLSRQKDMWLLW